MFYLHYMDAFHVAFSRNPHCVRLCVGDGEDLSGGHGVSAANQSGTIAHQHENVIQIWHLCTSCGCMTGICIPHADILIIVCNLFGAKGIYERMLCTLLICLLFLLLLCDRRSGISIRDWHTFNGTASIITLVHKLHFID